MLLSLSTIETINLINRLSTSLLFLLLESQMNLKAVNSETNINESLNTNTGDNIIDTETDKEHIINSNRNISNNENNNIINNENNNISNNENTIIPETPPTPETIIPSETITNNNNKPVPLTYPFGVIDLFNLRYNTYSIITNNNNITYITRRMNMPPYYSLYKNESTNNNGVEVYEMERLINNNNSNCVYHPVNLLSKFFSSTSISDSNNNINNNVYNIESLISKYTIISLYLTNSAKLNKNLSNILVLPDEFFFEPMNLDDAVIKSDYNISNNITSNNNISYLISCLSSSLMYPIRVMSASQLQLSENHISTISNTSDNTISNTSDNNIDNTISNTNTINNTSDNTISNTSDNNINNTNNNNIINIHYSRETLTITYLLNNTIVKRQNFKSKFGSTSFRNYFIKILKETLIKKNINSKFNILTEYNINNIINSNNNNKKYNIVLVGDEEPSYFSTITTTISNTSNNYIKDLKYSILPINSFIDTFLTINSIITSNNNSINNNNKLFKFRLPIYNYPSPFYTPTYNNKNTVGMFIPMEIDLIEVGNKLSKEFEEEINKVIMIITNNTNNTNNNINNNNITNNNINNTNNNINNILISPIPCNIIQSNVKYIKSQLNKLNIKYEVPLSSQVFSDIISNIPNDIITNINTDIITNINTNSDDINNSKDQILKELLVYKTHTSLIKELKKCKYIDYKEYLLTITNNNDNINISNKSQQINQITALLNEEKRIKTDYDLFNETIVEFNNEYNTYNLLYNNNISNNINNKINKVLNETKPLLNKDYYDNKLSSIVKKHIEEFIIKVNEIITNTNKEELIKEDIIKEGEGDVIKEDIIKEGKGEVKEDNSKENEEDSKVNKRDIEDIDL